MSDDYQADLHEDIIRTNVLDPVLLGRMLGFVKPYRRMAALGLSLTLVSVLAALAAPLFVSILVDELIPFGNVPQGSELLRQLGLEMFIEPLRNMMEVDGKFTVLVWFASFYFLAKLTQFLLDWSNGYLLAKLSQNVLMDVRMKVFEHIQTRSLSYFHRNRVGRLITRVTNDVGALDEFFSQALLSVMNDFALLGGIITLLFVANSELAVIVLSMLIPLVAMSLVFRHFARKAYRKWRAALSHLNAVMAETAGGVKIVQLFHREQRNLEKYSAVGDEWKANFLKHRFAWALYRPGYTVIQACSMGLVLWFGGSWALDQELTAGTLVLFIFLAERFFQPVRNLVDKFDIVQSAMTSAERLFTVLDEKDALPLAEKQVEAGRVNGEIRFRDVEFEYIPGEPVLRKVSFEVKPGQMVAIVGHTGAGKSTIINLISRFYDIQAGSITVDGVDVREYSLNSLRKNVSVVHQDVFLFAGTIRENISLNNPEISEERVREACEAVSVDTFINRYSDGYDHHVEERGKTFSAGERQLLSFARALAHNPSVLVLDEATSSIDTKSEQLIQRAMKVVMQGRTSIVIAHRLSTIQDADLILVMHKGELAEQGTHQELLAQRGLYHKLYQLQFAGA